MAKPSKKVEMIRPTERYSWWARMAWREFTSYEKWMKHTCQMLESVGAGLPPDILDRVDYYAVKKTPYRYRPPLRLGNLSWKMDEMYYLDLIRIAKGFGKRFRLTTEFHVVVDIPPVPTLLRTRPIAGNPDRSILMPFNRFRHFYFPTDPHLWETKKPAIGWRGRAVGQMPRIKLLERYHDHPEHDIGHIAANEPYPGYKGFMSVQDQMRFRYIPGFEGANEATNLKWIFNSGSVALCHDMRFEGWFMEGRLKPFVHFIRVRRDLADLDEKIDWYNRHPDEAREIVRNANAWAAEFKDEDREDLIATLVMLRYAKLTDTNMPEHLKQFQDLV